MKKAIAEECTAFSFTAAVLLLAAASPGLNHHQVLHLARADIQAAGL